MLIRPDQIRFDNQPWSMDSQVTHCCIQYLVTSYLLFCIEVCEMFNPTTSQYLTGLDKSDWFKHIKGILEASYFISYAIHVQNTSVVVHCSGREFFKSFCSVNVLDSVVFICFRRMGSYGTVLCTFVSLIGSILSYHAWVSDTHWERMVSVSRTRLVFR